MFSGSHVLITQHSSLLEVYFSHIRCCIFMFSYWSVLRSAALTSLLEVPPPLGAIAQWGPDLHGPHTGSQQSLPPSPPGSLAFVPTQGALQEDTTSDEWSLKSSMLLHKTSGTHRRPPALQDRCPFLPPYSCPHKHTCQHHFFWCERSLVCPHGPENNTVIVSILYLVTEKGFRLKYPCTCPFLFHNNSICFLNPESPTDAICIRLLAAHTHSDDDGCSLCATMWCHLICFLEMLCL